MGALTVLWAADLIPMWQWLLAVLGASFLSGFLEAAWRDWRTRP
jgi:hypothetical protein